MNNRTTIRSLHVFFGCLSLLILLPRRICCDAFSVVVVGVSREFFRGPSLLKRQYNHDSPFVLSLTSQKEEQELIDVDASDVTTAHRSHQNNSYEKYSQQLQNLVSITSRDASAVPTALKTLDEMVQQSEKDPTLSPDVHIYNKLLQICAYSSNTTAIDSMEQMMSVVQGTFSSNDLWNDVSYSILAEAYLQRHQFQKVVDMMEELRVTNPHVLTTTVLNKLIKGYGQNRQPERAMETLERMLEQSTNQNKNDMSHPMYPNRKSWIHVLRAWAVSDSASKEKTCRILLERMKEYYPRLDTQTYNAYLQGLVEHPKIAEQTLYEMIANQIIPNEESFFHVLRALRKTKKENTQGLCFKAEQFLNLFKSFDMPMTDRVRTMAIAVMARDTSRNNAQKAKKAHALYLSMEHTPSHFAITQVLRACSSSMQDKAMAFQIAESLWESIPEHQQDSSIIAEYLRVIANLVESPNQKDSYASHAFDMACRKGIVNKAVLKQFQRAASEQVVLKTLGGFLEDGIQLPMEWSQNVVER